MHLQASEVREKRADLSLTQKEFAAALGMGSNGERTVRRWEAGETAPSAAESAFISSLGHSAPFDQGNRPNAPFTYVDLFAGIGGIRMPLSVTAFAVPSLKSREKVGFSIATGFSCGSAETERSSISYSTL